MAERRLSERNAKIAAMLESGEGLKNFYRFIAQNEYINLHDACQIVAERPDATVCNSLEEWNAMGRRVIKGRKSIAYYDHDGYKQFVFDANDTYGDGRYQRPILPLKHLLIGLDELNDTNAYEENGRGDYRKVHNGVYTYLEKQNELTGDEQYGRLLAEGIAYSLYCKTGFPKTQNIRLHELPYSYRENAAFVKELYIRSELLAEEIEEAYQSKQSEVEVINDIDEETVSDEPVVQSEPAEQTETREQPEQGVETADEIHASEQESENLAPEQGAAVSPVYRQYLEAQKLDPKAIVLLRVGDFYEVMGENARIVAEEVGLTLTSRDVGLPERVPMCGFPYFASDAYIERIIEKHGVILAEDGKEPIYVLSHAEVLEQRETAGKKSVRDDSEAEELAELFGDENDEQSAPSVKKPVLTEIDDEPMPFDDEQPEEDEDAAEADESNFEQVESEAKVKPAPKKDEKGIQDRKRKQKPQMSMFDLIEPKTEREQLIERALQYGSGFQYGKYRIFDKYNENPTPKAFAGFVKHEYGIGGHGSTNGDDEWHDGKGIRISHDGTDGKIEVLLKWQDVAFRIADLIDDDNYLTEQEKTEYVKYRAEQNRKKELRAEEERQKRELIEQVIVKEPPVRKQRILDEYSQTTKIVDFAVFLCDEYGTATEATSQYHARYDKNGVWLAKYDRVGNTELRVYLSWEQFAEKVCDVIERERLFAPEDAVYNQSFVERMVKQGTQNTEDGQYSFYFGTFEKDESYVRAHCEEIKEALLSREEVKTVGSDEWYIRAEFYKEYCEKLKGTEEARREHDARVEAIAERIVEEGTRNTTEGNWVTFFDELSRDENFAKANAEEIAAELERHQEVSDVELTPDAFDTNFYLDYCPNYLPQAGEDGYEESEPSNSEQGENTDLSAVLDQTDLGGAKTRFKNNVAAIRLINFLDERGAMATDSEKKVLSQFVGWGGLSQAFDEKNESWKREYAELKTLLSAEDYEQARSSTLNAYYTPKEVIGGIYAALQRFGVKGNNRILEPAMGTGNFFGYMPREIADGSRLYGVELDNITGRIAAKLYPQASVQIKGFEDTSFPNDKFDLVVGNVPFGGYGVADSDYNRYNFKVHDYFLAKSVDKVRPGGIVAVITSKGTMDKLNPSARKYVAERAELLGAVRLPNNAFKQTAGTEAVADILFFRKRTEKITDLSKEEWLGTGKTAEGYEINNYFLAHPEMILGTLAEEHGLYGGIDTTVKPDGRNLQDALAEAIRHLPQSFYINPEIPPEQEREMEADYNVKPFCYKAERGKLYQRVGDEMVEQAIPKTPKDAYQRICGMIGLRESLHHILDIQIAGCSDEVLTREQWALNSRYDLFIKKYGNLNSQTNSKLFKDDGDSALLFACENVNEETKAVTKADVFFKRTIRPYVVPTSTDDPFEALQISKNERGKVDVAYIEELTGKSYDTVLSELGNAVFRDPEQVNAEDQYLGFVTSEEYLSGQVVTKLEQAKALAAKHPEYQKNAAALEAVQPEPLSASEIAVRLGATWVDKAYYKQFYCELVGVRWYQESDVELFYNPHDSSWRIDQTPNVRYATQMNQTEVYGTKRAPAYRLFIDAMNLKATTIYDTIEEDGREKRVLNQAETIAAREKQNKIKEAFAEWIFKSPERREELEATYNRLFNRTRLPSYDGSYLKFPEMNPAIELKPHQKNAVHRIITSGSSTLLHHVVGAGKTFTVIASIMKIIRQGNTNEKVQIFTYVMERTFDSYSYQILENKQRFISQINRGDLTIREAEDIDETTLSYAEIKAVTAANPKIKRKMEVDAEVARLRVLEGQYRKNLYDLQDKIYKTYPEEIRKQELLIERIGKDLEMLKTRHPVDPEAFEISVNGKVYTDKKEGGKALTDALYGGKVGTPVAEYCGFVISMNPMSFLATEREITLAGEGQYVITIGDSASGNLTRIENFLNDLPEREKRLKSKLEQLKSDLAIAKEQAGKPFEQAERLQELLSEQAQLNAELNLNKHEDAIVDDEEEEDETAYRALPEIRKTEVDIIDEEDKVAAMQVDLLPDYTVTQEDMHAYGYTWDGMLPVSRRTAYRLWSMGLGVHKLAPDDTDMPVEQYGDLNPHERVYYGIEKPVWINYLASESSIPYLYARKAFCDAASKVANEDLSSVDERFTIDFIETNFRERTALERYLANKERPDPNVLPGYVPELLDEFSARMWSDVLHEYGWAESDMPRAIAEHLEEPALQKAANQFLSRETEKEDGSPLYEENVGMTNSVKEIDYEAEVIKSVNTEFEVYKADMLSKSAEAIFEDSYKINTMSELKDILEIGT